MAVSQPSGGEVRWANVLSLARQEEEEAGGGRREAKASLWLEGETEIRKSERAKGEVGPAGAPCAATGGVTVCRERAGEWGKREKEEGTEQRASESTKGRKGNAKHTGPFSFPFSLRWCKAGSHSNRRVLPC